MLMMMMMMKYDYNIMSFLIRIPKNKFWRAPGSARGGDLLVALVRFNIACLYLDRHRMKYRGNLRFRALFSEKFHLRFRGQRMPRVTE